MSRIETIKGQFHALIDQAQDETVLSHFYDVLASSMPIQAGTPENGLSEQQRASINQSYEESRQAEKMILNTDVWKKYDQWLTR